MNRQRGQVMLYGALAAGLVIVALGIALKVQSSRLDTAQKATATAEANAAQWQATSKLCSDATDKLALEGQERARRAQVALSAARQGNAASQAEIARLRGTTGQSCEGAVSEVRKGLQK